MADPLDPFQLDMKRILYSSQKKIVNPARNGLLVRGGLFPISAWKFSNVLKRKKYVIICRHDHRLYCAVRTIKNNLLIDLFHICRYNTKYKSDTSSTVQSSTVQLPRPMGSVLCLTSASSSFILRHGLLSTTIDYYGLLWLVRY